MLSELQGSLRPLGAEVRWVAISSIHLTLKFLGEVDPAIIAYLSESLRKASISEQSFTLRLHGLGCFPNQRNPRVIWCGIDGDTDQLILLQQNIEKSCTALGFPPEDRPFHPHLTLGRIRGKRNLQGLLDHIKIGSDLERSFKIDYYHIYRSTLKPQGATYDVVDTIEIK